MLLHNPQGVVELAGDDFGLAGVVVEMLLLAGDFEMSAAGEVAVDCFFDHDLFDAVDGGERRGIHALSEFASVHGDELVHAQLHAGEHHASIARTGAPADGFGFEHGDFRAAFGQGAGGGEAGKTRADHGYVDNLRQRALRSGGELCCGEPVVLFLQGHGQSNLNHREHRGAQGSGARVPGILASARSGGTCTRGYGGTRFRPPR